MKATILNYLKLRPLLLCVLLGSIFLPVTQAHAYYATIYDAWWSSVADHDGDGCVAPSSSSGYMQLNWDPDVQGCSGSMVVYEKIYYKSASSSTWTLFYTTSPHTITACVTSDQQGLGISADAGCSLWDYRIEIYESGYSTPDYARDASNDADLNDHKEETYAQDNAVAATATIYDAWWSNPVDSDGDGYPRQFRLNWDSDVAGSSGSLSVFEKVYYKASASSTWTLFYTTSAHTITGNSTADAQYLDLNGDSHGTYDYKVEVYRSGQTVADYTRDPSNDSDLNDHVEETAAEDPVPCVPYATVYDAWWSNPVDNDGDGYPSQFRLNWDSDNICSGSLSVFEKVYYKASASSTWTLITTTSAHTITGSSTVDAQYLDLNGDPHGTYDYKIEVYRSGQTVADYVRDPSNDSDLNDHPEETPDVVTETATVYDAWWSNPVDSDGDGYPRQFRLNWDSDVAGSSGSLSVFEKVYYKASASSTWTLFYTTSAHTITGNSTADAQYLDLNGDSHGTYDYKVEVYRSGQTVADYTRDPSNDADLNDHPEETAAEDPLDTTITRRRALLVGIDHYAPAYGASPLPSCINDATGTRDVLMLGDPDHRWFGTNLTLLTDSQASKTSIRNNLQNLAATSVADDLVIYYHSSHGGQYSGMNVFLCSYNADYTDAELGADLALFPASAKVIVIVDACRSGGLFKDLGWPFIESVMANYQTIKTAQYSAKGEPIPKDIGGNIAFMTAANYDENSWAGDPYSLYAGFLITGCSDSSVDTGGNGQFEFSELHTYAAQRASAANPSQTAQSYNVALLQTVAARAVVATPTPTATVYNASWTSQVDSNGNSFCRSATLNWDPDVVGSGGSLTVFEKVYYKTSASSTWTLLTTTATHTITGTATSDTQSLSVTNHPHGTYDYKIELYRSGQTVADYTRDPGNDTDLNAHPEETAAEDTVVGQVTVYNASWSNVVDTDGDGYPRSFRLNWDPNVVGGGSVAVFEKVYYKASASSTWVLITTTSDHTITGTTSGDAQYLVLNGDPHGTYDYKIELYRSGQTVPDYTCDPSNDSDLNDHLEETASQDVPVIRPLLGSAHRSGTTFTVSVPTQVGFNYTLEYKNSLSDANWTTGQMISGTGGTITLTDTGATGSSRLYHVRVQ